MENGIIYSTLFSMYVSISLIVLVYLSYSSKI